MTMVKLFGPLWVVLMAHRRIDEQANCAIT